MIFWVILFLVVVGISFVLAFRSMKDYQEIPQTLKTEYGLFLVRRTENFGLELLDRIQKLILEQGLIVSFERLFKGSKSALTIFGPKKILDQFRMNLNLLELEDYIFGVMAKDIVIWEVGTKSRGNLDLENIDPASDGAGNIFQTLPAFEAEEQFFWQVVLGKDQTQIRAALFTKDPARRKTLVPLLQNLGSGKLIKVPRPFSTEQMLDFFKARVLSKDSKSPVLTGEGIARLLKV